MLAVDVPTEPVRLLLRRAEHHPGLPERVHDGTVQLAQGEVAPERLDPGVAGQAEHLGDPWQGIEPALRGQVTAGDLVGGVPAAEDARPVPALVAQQHVGDHRGGVPAQPEAAEPGRRRVADRHLEDHAAVE